MAGAAGRRYASDGSQTNANPVDTTITLTSASTVRPVAYYFGVSCGVTAPADNAILWTAQRCTAIGTGTADTPQALDPGDPASLATVTIDHTGEPTFTANATLFNLCLNQRATLQWFADAAGGLMAPATANAGIGWFSTNTSYTGDVYVTVHWAE